ncbi:LysE family translocator [Snuella lapsa]|uniref:LysE family translocator n=1 Tax=Snuella lapsa TaxID=870481 RepID=A0ABP6XJA6_9FLAO
MEYSVLISFTLASAALAVSPGPDNVYVLMQSIVHGKKYGIATVLGLMTGCLVHTTLVAFGVSTIIQQNDKLFLIIKLFGVGYLFYLAFNVYRSNAQLGLDMQSVPKKSLIKLYRQGFIMNVLNPKVSLFFLAFFPGFLFSDYLSNVSQFYILGGFFIVVSFIVFSSIAILSDSIAVYIKGHKRAGVFFKWFQIIVLVCIGILILV